MSFFSNLFGDRSGTEKEERKAVADKLASCKVSLGKAKEVPAPTRAEEAKNQSEFPNYTNMPDPSKIGVELHIARLAATLSNQLYYVAEDRAEGKEGTYKLSTPDHEVEIIVDDPKPKYVATNPPFAAVVCHETMIVGWRGSTTYTDWLMDFAWAPCSNLALGPHSKNIKLQGGMTSLLLNDIVAWQDTLVAECKKRGIKEIVFSGHSLGGAMGQVGHTIVRAQMENRDSPWADLKGVVNVRSVVFSAPMSTMIVADGCAEDSKKFLQDVNDNSCNFVFHNDPVPRSYGYGSYLSDFLTDASSGIGTYLLSNMRFPHLITSRFIGMFASYLNDTLIQSEEIQEIVAVWSGYIHPGAIVSYDSYEAEPRYLVDYGAYHKNTGQVDTFRSVPYVPAGKGEDVIGTFSDNHSGPLYGMEYKSSEVH